MTITHSLATGLVFKFDPEDGLSQEDIDAIKRAAVLSVYSVSSA